MSNITSPSNSGTSPQPSSRLQHYVAPISDVQISAVDSVALAEKKTTLWREAWRDMRKRPMFWVSAVIILLVLTASLIPSLFTSLDPRSCTLSLSNNPAEPGHVFGFDRQGCDVYTRVIYGTSTSLLVGILSVTLTFVIGVLAGSLGGFFGGVVDAVLSRLGDIFFSIPYILAGVVVMSVLMNYRNPFVIAVAIGGFSWPITARIVRSEVLRVKNADFVLAAEALGLSRWRALLRHILPNAIAPAIVVTTISLSAAIVAESVLSFLGVGLPPGQYLSWGNDISAAQITMRTAPLPLVYPSLALAITVLGFIMFGEVVRDALDPKARAQR